MAPGQRDAKRPGGGERRRRRHEASREQLEAARTQLPDGQPLELDSTERLERAEEHLVPHVERVRVGNVALSKRVVEEPESVSVTLAHDRLDLERRSMDRPLEPGEEPISSRGEETVLLVVEERLEVRKVPWVVEEIRLRRQVVREEREISDTVRKTRFEIDASGDVELREGTD